ncbi:MAG: GTPase [Flavobacteriales bacterium]|nr:GTPase [Flavobacteriales bacterium]
MRLIFVYNATSGKHNAVLDSLRKIANPTNYNCSLCTLTYGVFSEKKTWKRFRKRFDLEMEFLHKDEFLKLFRSKWLPKYTFPVVLSEKNNELQLFISSEELAVFEDVSELIETIKLRAGQY